VLTLVCFRTRRGYLEPDGFGQRLQKTLQKMKRDSAPPSQKETASSAPSPGGGAGRSLAARGAGSDPKRENGPIHGPRPRRVIHPKPKQTAVLRARRRRCVDARRRPFSRLSKRPRPSYSRLLTISRMSSTGITSTSSSRSSDSAAQFASARILSTVLFFQRERAESSLQSH